MLCIVLYGVLVVQVTAECRGFESHLEQLFFPLVVLGISCVACLFSALTSLLTCAFSQRTQTQLEKRLGTQYECVRKRCLRSYATPYYLTGY